MPLRHEREIEEILAHAGSLGRRRHWWARLPRPKFPRLRRPSGTTIIVASVLVLLAALVYGRFGRTAGMALVAIGLALLLTGYAIYMLERAGTAHAGARYWRGEPINKPTREPWWRRWRRRGS